MRKALIALLIGSLFASGFEASTAFAAKKKKKKVTRTVVLEYTGALTPRGVTELGCAQESVGCVVFPVKKRERYVTIEIADAAGQPVWASVYVYGYTDGTDTHEHVCATSDAPFPMIAGLAELVVGITQTTAGATNPCAGPATRGTVTATFSNLP